MGREEKIETKHLSTKETQVETVLTVNYQSKESLEIHESGMGQMTDELGEFVNHEVKQANDTCEPSTFANDEIVTDMIQGDKVKGTYTDIKRSYKVSDPSVENHSGIPLEYHESSQENRTVTTGEASVKSYSYSSMDREDETKHLSMKKAHLETVLTVNDQSKESLETHESSLEEKTNELGEVVNYEMNKGSSEPCEPCTVETNMKLI